MLGVVCSYDTFHNRLLISARDGDEIEIDQRLIGDVSDDSLLALRQIISDEFGFDPTAGFVRDAVVSLANQNRFDPVANMIDEAEAAWDGVKRLDRMAADYFNCADKPLNRAFFRKTMIAAVARVRQPGCKFDTILVTEGPEGHNKSTAWRIIAGNENFSDEPVIGHAAREVIEQLGGVWICEAADLAGMSKKEVESVKAFASRTTDRARPAYGHMLKEQRRHCIIVGTTNADTYLQSQTGNRRFWPVKVLAPIDLEKLAADRLQLIGEAAHYESEGESLFLDQALWGDAAVEQERRRVKDSWEDTLADAGGYAFVADGQERISSATIIEDILDIKPAQQTTGMAMRVATVMKQLGWHRNENNNVVIKGRQVKGFWRETTREPTEEKPPPARLPERRMDAKDRVAAAMPETKAKGTRTGGTSL